MIEVSVKRQNDDIIGFHIEGHSGYADRGSDIICSAVSALAVNCVNSVEELTEDHFSMGSDEERGMIDFELTGTISPESALLLRSLFLGIKGLEKSYRGRYVRLIDC